MFRKKTHDVGSAESQLQAAESEQARLADEVSRLQAEVTAQQGRREAADKAVIELTEQAAAGTLKDSTRLAAALRHQREVAQDNGPATALQTAQTEQRRLDARLHELRQKAAAERYSRAVCDYAQACAPLPALAQRVRDAAVDAGVTLTLENSPHLVGRELRIGDALVAIPSPSARA